MPKKEVRRNDRYVHYAWAAAVEAMARRRPRRTRSPTRRWPWRTGAIIGSGIGGINTMIRDVIEAHEPGHRARRPFLVTALIPDMGGRLRRHLRQCAWTELRHGQRLLEREPRHRRLAEHHPARRRRRDDRRRRGGGDRRDPGRAPSAPCARCRPSATTTRRRPPARSTRERDGFVMADGAGILVLEELEHAQARGATIHAEVVGYGATDDASHITLPAPGGRGAVGVMRIAIADAGLTTDDIDYINAHGTSTPPNDRSETAAIKTALRRAGLRASRSAARSRMTGHLHGRRRRRRGDRHASRRIKTGIIPPTINLEHPDPECDLDYVPNEARQRRGGRRHEQQLRLRRAQRHARLPPVRRRVHDGRAQRPDPGRRRPAGARLRGQRARRAGASRPATCVCRPGQAAHRGSMPRCRRAPSAAAVPRRGASAGRPDAVRRAGPGDALRRARR